MPIELRAGGARAVILPEHGGRLHQLFVPVDGHEEPLLHSPENVDEYRARPTRGGSFPMAPWPNRVANGRFRWQGRDFQLPLDGKPHAIHGRVLGAGWTVESAAETSCELSVRFDHGWPWRGSAWQRFELTPMSLAMTLEVRADDEPFPAGCGWHPWFRREVGGGEGVRLLLPAGRRYVLAEQIPTGERVAPEGIFDLGGGPILGERRLDDCYAGLTAPIRVDWQRVQLMMSVECSEPHVMVYTPPEAICVEPQTCSPDAFNLAGRGIAGAGFAVAAPGAPVRIASTWSWEGGC